MMLWYWVKAFGGFGKIVGKFGGVSVGGRVRSGTFLNFGCTGLRHSLKSSVFFQKYSESDRMREAVVQSPDSASGKHESHTQFFNEQFVLTVLTTDPQH